MGRTLMVWASVLVLAGCGKTTETGVVPNGATLPATGTSLPNVGVPAGIPGPTGDTNTDTRIEFDCSVPPPPLASPRHVPAARGYHDVAFGPDGTIIGANGAWNSDLIKADNAGNGSLWVPMGQTIQQMVWLPNGNLAVAADPMGVVEVTNKGGTSVLNPNIRAYGLILGPDEMLYAVYQSQVHRIDPSTGQAEVLVPNGALTNGAPRVLNFNLDYTKLYMGTLSGSQGRIYEVDLDKSLTPITQPVVFASGVGSGSYHDTMGVDICGSLYVADYSTSTLYRITPGGGVIALYTDNQEYGHGMEWGTGLDGWGETSIYLSQPYNQYQVLEIDIGIPSRLNPNYVAINLP